MSVTPVFIQDPFKLKRFTYVLNICKHRLSFFFLIKVNFIYLPVKRGYGVTTLPAGNSGLRLQETDKITTKQTEELRGTAWVKRPKETELPALR